MLIKYRNKTSVYKDLEKWGNGQVKKNYRKFIQNVSSANNYFELRKKWQPSHKFEKLLSNENIWSARLNKKWRVEYSFSQSRIENNNFDESKILEIIRIHPHKYNLSKKISRSENQKVAKVVKSNFLKELVKKKKIGFEKISQLSGLKVHKIKELVNQQKLISTYEAKKLSSVLKVDYEIIYSNFVINKNYNKLAQITTCQKFSIIEAYTKDLNFLKDFEDISIVIILEKLFKTYEIDDYVKSFFQEIEFTKERPKKPLAILWFALNWYIVQNLKPINSERKNVNELCTEVLDILLKKINLDFLLRIEEVKDLLSKNGIILNISEYIKDSRGHATSFAKDNVKYIFLTNRNKREYVIIFNLLSEISLHFNPKRKNKVFASTLIKEYIESKKLDRKDNILAIETYEKTLNQSENEQNELWSELRLKTKQFPLYFNNENQIENFNSIFEKIVNENFI